MRSLRFLGAALSLGLAAPLLAQQPGTVDIGIYGRMVFPDDQLSNETPRGGGGRFGLFFLRRTALEFDVSRSETAKQTYSLMQPFSARLAYHAPMGANWSAILGAGWVHETIDPPVAGGEYADDGLTAAFGLQRRLGGRVSLRMDVVYERFESPIFETPANDITMSHLALQAGVNWRFHDKPRDTDADGVSDRTDACAGTPAGSRVDARGCIPDSDGDGVTDPNDACANTPMGTRVNARGCVPDTDGDGVVDANDSCANTPAGTRVDASGCAIPVDSDRDGVMDNADRCANTPAGTRVDAGGCPVPVDSDRDGVMDNVDRCPNTPAGAKVDATGCVPAVDTDADGVLDGVDACPNTPRSTPVDARGCTKVFEEGQKSIVLEGVNFASGSAILTEGSKTVLDKMAALLLGAPDVNVEVQGHTDNTGSAASNTRISGLRAEAVRAYLVSKGVNAARLTAKGYGPALPVADNGTPAGRAQNRRVELKRTN